MIPSSSQDPREETDSTFFGGFMPFRRAGDDPFQTARLVLWASLARPYAKLCIRPTLIRPRHQPVRLKLADSSPPAIETFHGRTSLNLFDSNAKTDLGGAFPSSTRRSASRQQPPVELVQARDTVARTQAHLVNARLCSSRWERSIWVARRSIVFRSTPAAAKCTRQWFTISATSFASATASRRLSQ